VLFFVAGSRPEITPSTKIWKVAKKASKCRRRYTFLRITKPNYSENKGNLQKSFRILRLQKIDQFLIYSEHHRKLVYRKLYTVVKFLKIDFEKNQPLDNEFYYQTIGFRRL
jgi:hypothetical protein